MNSLHVLVHEYVKERLPEGWRATLHACMGWVTVTEGARPQPTTYHEVRITDGTTMIKVQIYKSWLGTVPETEQRTLTDANFDVEAFLDKALALLPVGTT